MKSVKSILVFFAFFAAAFPSFAQADRVIHEPIYAPGERTILHRVDCSGPNKGRIMWTVDRTVVETKGRNLVLKFVNTAPAELTETIGRTGQGEAFVIPYQVLHRPGSGREGIQQLVTFPLFAGKTWSYKTAHMSTSGDRVQRSFDAKAVGWESVTVPAGTFNAMRIEHDGRVEWSWAEKPQSVRETNIVWYVPELKQIARHRFEQYQGVNGTMSHCQTIDVKSYWPAPTDIAVASPSLN